MTTWTLKAADHQHRTAVTACDTERQAGKQRIVIVVQPKRAFAFAFGLTCGRGVDGLDFAVFCLEPDNWRLLRAGQRVGEGDVFQTIYPLIVADDSIGPIV